ncbi:hypothetical protein ACI797_18935 [Geodermatophilus sp. SYSU D00691]
MSPARTVTRRSSAGPRKRTAARPGVRRRPVRRAAKGRGKGFSLRRLEPAQWWPPLLIALVVLLGFAWDADGQDVPVATAQCTLPATGITLTAEQIANARTIAQVGWERGLPERAVVIALATAMQESRLRNLDYGDRDSLGLFQQRPSMGWGTPEQVQDPVYAAGKFYDGLVQVPDWQSLRVTDAAQRVQRSGFPEAYEQHSPLAVELTSALAADQPLCTEG